MEEFLRTYLKAAPGLEGVSVDWGNRPRIADFPGIVLNVVSESNGHTHNQGADRLVTARVQVDIFASNFGQAKTLARAVKERLDGYNGAPFAGIFFDSGRDLNEEGTTSDTRVYRNSQDYQVKYQAAGNGYEPEAPVRYINIDSVPVADLLQVGDVFVLDVAALVNTNLPSGTEITYSVFLGALPMGTMLDAATGLVSGIIVGSGLYVFAIRAQAGDVFATQTFAVDVPALPALPLGSGGVENQFDLFGESYNGYLFTSSGVFEVVEEGWFEVEEWGPGPGGARGGAGTAGGGGGAGEKKNFSVYLQRGTYPILVGAAGAGRSGTVGSGFAGTPTSAFGVSAASGQPGGFINVPSNPGGSGGGAGATNNSAGAGGVAGSKLTGSNGGNGNASSLYSNRSAGGGGGFSTAGGSGNSSNAGSGGHGTKSNFLGSPIFGLGGGGGAKVMTGGAGSGQYGGGNGAIGTANAGNGAFASGSAGGGSVEGNSGNGGGGRVMIRCRR